MKNKTTTPKALTFAEWRAANGFSQRAAARHISNKTGRPFSATQVDKLERGVTSPTITTADRIKRGTDGMVTRLSWPEREE